MALINKLEAIGDAIREKTGTTELLTLDEMVTAISGITGGGEGECSDLHIPEDAFEISRNCSYMFYQTNWDWFIEQYGDIITTSNINSAVHMFGSSKIKTLPFEINFCDGGCEVNNMFEYAGHLENIPSIDFKQTSTYKNAEKLFSSCTKLKQIGTIKNLYPEKMTSLFSGCNYLRVLPEFENLNMNRIYTYNYAGCGQMFSNCYSLRVISEEFLKKIYAAIATSATYIQVYNQFYNCYALDEIRGLNPQTGKLTSNVFTNCFNNCHRLKDIIFATQEDGTPYVVNWSNQNIELSYYTGWTDIGSDKVKRIINYKSGITADKEVTDNTSYQALKDDPDWFTQDVAYSRYNHDSAVNTINSLPDVSQGSGNVIKFKGTAGSATDGGAINTLTEEEIAVAAAKGWTVTLA